MERFPDSQHLEEDLQLALALSASEAEARSGDSQQQGSQYRDSGTAALPAGRPAAVQQNGPFKGSKSDGAGPSLLGRLANGMADGLKRAFRPTSGAEQRRPSTAPPEPWACAAVPPAAGASWNAPPPHPPRNPVADDEALARALQEQFDREEEEQRRRHQQQHDMARPPPRPSLQYPVASLGPLAGTACNFSTAPPPVPPVAATASVSGTCAGCGQPLTGLTSFFGGGGRYINALGRSWHPDCFKCSGCGRPLAGPGGGVQFNISNRDGLPYHSECHRQRFHPCCQVCSDYVPVEGGNQIVWSETPFWKDKYCPCHNQDGTKRCTGCTRMQPRGEQWVDLDDGRVLCLDCLNSLVADTADCQPLWDDVLRFYADMGMPLPLRPPMMLVESGALNQAEQSETHGAGRTGPVFHTRGLCITEEYQSFQTVMRVRRGGGGGGRGGLLGGVLPGGYSLEPHTVQLGPTRAEVTAILVLYALPWLLTGSILAHEAMHAWLRLSGYRRLPQQVEEGMCQLMALLWLERQQPQQGSYEERLASFLANQIRTDPSEVYGDGFRAALEAFQRFGLQTVLAHLRQAGKLPV